MDAVVRMCVEVGSPALLDRAVAFLDGMVSGEEEPQAGCGPTMETATIVVSMCAEKGRAPEALRWLRYMQAAKGEPSDELLTSVVDTCHLWPVSCSHATVGGAWRAPAASQRLSSSPPVLLLFARS